MRTAPQQSICLTVARRCWKVPPVVLLLLSLIAWAIDADQTLGQEPQGPDPLFDGLEEAFPSTVEVLLEQHHHRRLFRDTDFPLDVHKFAEFRELLVDRLTKSLELQHWTVRGPLGKSSRLSSRYRDRVLRTVQQHGVQMEVHAVEFPETGAVVPMVICLPEGQRTVPGVCVFSGHSRHGLRDLVLDLDSYQAGMATRLAQAGFATIAVEKIDTGYLSRDGRDGNDETEIATYRLGWGRVTRSHQLMACLAATEILAEHPRVDFRRIGATGVSLGGWLATQTGLLSDRISVVADFGVKTLLVPEHVTAADFQGIGDLCHILPGMFEVGERNLLTLAWCPRPMLAGHGRLDGGSQRDAPAHYESLLRKQYETLGATDNFRYLIHEGGDTMPPAETVAFFQKQLGTEPVAAQQIAHLQGEMTGEVTSHSAILHSRLTSKWLADDGDVPGMPGVARYEYSTSADFESAQLTDWVEAVAEHDFIVQAQLSALKPATTYYYRLVFGPDQKQLQRGPVRSFTTHAAADVVTNHSFVVVTGMNYEYFHNGQIAANGTVRKAPYSGPDKQLGYPALASMLKLRPDFFVGTGDNVYYDSPRGPNEARTTPAIRKKWHEQFVQPRYVDLFARVPTYWEKDDHDFRYDDADRTTDREPSVELGLKLFREQVPVVSPDDPNQPTYRTHRCGKLLQVWFPENRDYRSPNLSPDGPEKTIWGAEQREWLKRTLLESDATFRIIVSPTPMIGPDDLRKKDNHCDIGGFQHERNEFFQWAKDHGLIGGGLFLVCGDRHWQYHAVHPSGMEEFSSGALVDANARLGVKPGASRGTDPEAHIRQPYTSREPSGGFLNVVVEPDPVGKTANASFRFYDEHGVLLHAVTRQQPLPE